MIPDAIAILSGGTVMYRDPETGEHRYRSTTEHDCDASGILWGSIRVEAGAILATQYPEVPVIVSGGGRKEPPSHAEVMQRELELYGVPSERILREEHSANTREQLDQLCLLARSKSFRSVLVVSNEYHLPRITAFLEHMPNCPRLSCVSAESIVMGADPNRTRGIEEVCASAEYDKRLQHEAAGIAALRAGTYLSRSSTHKQER